MTRRSLSAAAAASIAPLRARRVWGWHRPPIRAGIATAADVGVPGAARRAGGFRQNPRVCGGLGPIRIARRIALGRAHLSGPPVVALRVVVAVAAAIARILRECRFRWHRCHGNTEEKESEPAFHFDESSSLQRKA
jgi:hypothetical protein